MALPPLDELGLTMPDQSLGYQSSDQLLGVQPLSFNPPAAPSLPSPPQQTAPGAGDKIAGNQEILGHLQTVMQAAAAGKLPSGSAPGAPKGMTAASQTIKTTDDGMTPEQRATGVAVRGQADIDTKQIQADRAEQIANEAGAHAAKLRAEAQVESELHARAEKQNEQRQQRIREHQEALAEQRDEPINPNRYVENMSVFGKVTALISAAAYGYLNPRGQGVAPIVQQLQKMASEDTRAQMANNDEGRARRGDLIALYERRYGDTTLVAKKLEADKLMTFGKKALAEAEEAKSAQAKATAQDMGKGLLIQSDVLNRQVEEAYAAKPVSERTTTYKAAAGKDVDPAKRLEQWAAADKALEAQGVEKNDPTRVMLRAHFGVAASGKTAAEQTNAEQASKVSQLDTDEKKDLRTRLDGLANVAHGFDEIDKVGEIERDAKGNVIKSGDLIRGGAGPRQFIDAAAGSLPFGIGKGLKESFETADPENLKSLRRSVEKIVTGQVHAESGAGVNETELSSASKRLPLSSAESFKAGSAEMWRAHQQTYQNLKGQYAKKGIDIDAELRARGIDPARFNGGGK